MEERKFIDAVQSEDGHAAMAAADLEALDHCLVIIGAPGIGKSHFLRKQQERKPDRFYFLPVRDFVNGRRPQAGRTLLLDGLDECADSPDRVLDGLCRALNRCGQPRFWLSCRQASWVGDVFIPILHGCCSRIRVLRMLPLSRTDQERLVVWMRGKKADMQMLDDLRRGFGSHVAGNPLLLSMACSSADAFESGADNLGFFHERFVSKLMVERNVAVAYSKERLPEREKAAAAGRMMLVLLAAGRQGFMLPQAAAGSSDQLLALEDAVAPEQQPAARAVLGTSLFAGEAEALLPVHASVAEYMAGRHLAEQVAAGRMTWRLAACGFCGADIAGGQPPPPALAGMVAWFARHSPDRRKLLAIDPYGYVETVGAWDLDQHEYRILLQRLAESRNFHLTRNEGFWQRLQSPAAWLVDLFRSQLKPQAGEGNGETVQRRRKIVLDILSAGERRFPELMPTVAGLLADRASGEGLCIRALQCLVAHKSHGLIAGALRRVGKTDAGAAAWMRSRYVNRALSRLEVGGFESRKIIVNCFDGRCESEFFLYWHPLIEAVGKNPSLARFALAWMERNGRLQLAAGRKFCGSSLLAHLAAAAIDASADVDELLQLLLTPAGMMVAGQQAFSERLQQLPELKQELFGRLLALRCGDWSDEAGQLAFQLLKLGGYQARQIVAALENALAETAGGTDQQQAIGDLFSFLHFNDRRLEREIRLAAGAGPLAGMIAACRREQLLAGARTRLQAHRRQRRACQRDYSQPSLVEQVRADPSLIEELELRQLLFMHMRMRNPEIRKLLQPARGRYLERCRQILHDGGWPKIAKVSDDYSQGVKYIGQNPFLDGMEDLFAGERGEFARLPEQIIGIGIVFATVASQYRERLPEWLGWLADDEQRAPMIGKLVVSLVVKALRHKDAEMVEGWLDRYSGLFGSRLHLAVLGKSGKSSRLLGLAGLLAGVLQVSGLRDELSELIATKRGQPGFAGWPSAGCWHLAAWFLNGRQQDAQLLRDLSEDREALELVLKMASWLDRERMSVMQKAILLELAFSYFGQRSFCDGLLVDKDAMVAELIFDLQRDLENVNGQTYDAIAGLAASSRFAGFSSDAQAWTQRIIARSLPEKLDSQFVFPEPESLCRLLDDGRTPTGISSLKESLCEQLRALADRCRRNEGDLWKMFWNTEHGRRLGLRKSENECRNYIAELMQSPLAKLDVTIDCERQLAQEKRVDLWAKCRDWRLPVKVKCSDSRYLQNGGLEQIDSYSRHTACDGHGIYLVLWFGRAGRGRLQGREIRFPGQLEELLAERMRKKNPRIRVLVVDLSPPESLAYPDRPDPGTASSLAA